VDVYPVFVPICTERRPPVKRRFTLDDAIAAAAALREIAAGHEEAAAAILAPAGLDSLSNEELEALCARFGLEVQ
jgi:hypothetical protein